MFSGIVQTNCPIAQVVRTDTSSVLSIEMPRDLMSGLEEGCSVSIDGVCLTVAEFEETTVKFDLVLETLRKSTLGEFKQGDRVNVERSSRVGDEVGGHVVSGHVDSTARIIAIDKPGDNVCMRFRVGGDLIKYVFSKGFVAMNGCSLTVADIYEDESAFDIWLIPETLRRTTFGTKSIEDLVNVEFDKTTQVMVDCIERSLRRFLKPAT